MKPECKLCIHFRKHRCDGKMERDEKGLCYWFIDHRRYERLSKHLFEKVNTG